jgi:hypothetical protein
VFDAVDGPLRNEGEDIAVSDRLTAFLNTGTPSTELFAAAREKLASIRLGAMLFGGWVGLVVGGKLIALNLRRRRDDWQPDRGTCVSCGRCFWYCPVKGGGTSADHPSGDGGATAANISISGKRS